MNIIKANGRHEPFNETKLKNSIARACLNAHLTDEQSSKIADEITIEINQWLEGKNEIRSEEIFKKTAEILVKINPDASLMYESHRDIS